MRRRVQHRAQRDDRLPAPDVSLHQPVRRLRFRDVVQHVLEHAPLRPGELEGQRLYVGPQCLDVHRQPYGGRLLPVVLPRQQKELPHDHLVEGEPSPRLCLGVLGLRPVVRSERGRQRRQPLSLADVVGQQFRQPGQPCVQRIANDLA